MFRTLVRIAVAFILVVAVMPVDASAQGETKDDTDAGVEGQVLDRAFISPTGPTLSCGDSILNANDDQSTSLVDIGFTIDFLGTEYSQLYVNNNGNVTFDSALATYTPFGLDDTDRVIIAPFFADVDTRNPASGVVTFGQTTFEGHPAFCVSWNDVGYYNQKVDKINDFHLVLIERSDRGAGDFDILFRYDQIEWETGDFSGGSDGFGGTSAVAGYSSPSGAFEFAGSRTPGSFLDSSPTTGLSQGRLNSLNLGEYRLEVANGVAPPIGGSFVYAAFGDSYSSGEGAPAYEDGTNYPPAIEQENTLLEGTGCHRSLRSYPKINAPIFEPTELSILVERSCSGAQIVPGPGGTPIAPTAGTAGVNSQVDEAVDRLDRLHELNPGDVDLVTATMGGNDVGFGDVVAACLLPSVILAAVDEHPNPPTEAGILGWLVARNGTCSLIDGRLGQSRNRIGALPPVLVDAQSGLATQFDEALIYQLTYPHAVPDEDHFPGDFCGGIRSHDAGYARETVELLNTVIRDSVATTTGPAGGRIEVVELEDAFGSNPLCPSDGNGLVHGIDGDRLEAVVADVLAPGSESRGLIDDVLDRYGEWRNCKLRGLVPFVDGSCVNQEAALQAAADGVTDWAALNQEILVGNLVEGATEEERFENSRGLFHPNGDGVEIMACHVRAHYASESTAGCASVATAREYLINGVTLNSREPIPVTPGDEVDFDFNAWLRDIIVHVWIFSTPTDLGEFTTTADGSLSGTVTLPSDLEPGVHRLVFEGESTGGPRQIEVLVEVPGIPQPGDDYGIFLCCFAPGELVPVTLLGEPVGTWAAGSDGAIVASVPIPQDFEDRDLVVQAAGSATVETVTINACDPSTCSPPPPCDVPDFDDVDAASYYAEAVRWAACEGITSGTSATTFSPTDTVTRAQFAAFLWRLLGSPDGYAHSFGDVPSGAYYDGAVGWLSSNAITSGTSATAFSPANAVTRGQLAAFFARFAGIDPSGFPQPFTDVTPGAYYADPVAWLAQTGITSGTSATTFSPNRELTRAEVVTFLWRLSGEPAAE